MTGWASALVTVLLAGQGQVLLTFEDDRITESSGLVDAGDVVLTTNDSGDSARIFVVDKATGETVGVTTYDDEDPGDVEALAAGRDETLWVGDIGDNGGSRDHIEVHRIPMPTRGDRAVEPTSYELVYVDGPRDAEALLVHPRTGRLYVVSKGILGGTVYVAPRTLRTDGTNVLQPVGQAGGLVTDGVFLPDGRHALVRDYTGATLMRTRDFAALAWFALPDQDQGEGIAYTADGQVLASTEGTHTAVAAVRLPKRVERLLRPQATPEPLPLPVPDVRRDRFVSDRTIVMLLAGGWLVVAVLVVRAFRRRSRRTP